MPNVWSATLSAFFVSLSAPLGRPSGQQPPRPAFDFSICFGSSIFDIVSDLKAGRYRAEADPARPRQHEHGGQSRRHALEFWGIMLRGGITHISFDEIYGWARLSDTPYQPPLVQATVEGVVVAEAHANLFYEPFEHLGPDASYCAFMLDLHKSAFSHADRVLLLAGGEALPGGTLNLPRRPSTEEVFVEERGIAHVFAYRVGKYNIWSKQPLVTVWVYSTSRQVGSDRRRLGGVIGNVFADGVAVDISASSSFAEGFYNPEESSINTIRWTDGRARMQFPADNQPLSLSFEIYVLAADSRQA